MDGTLLNSKQVLSNFAKSEIEKLLNDGLNFTFATARSFHTANKVLSGLNWKLPAIFHNGVFIMDKDKSILSAEHLDRNAMTETLEDILSLGIRPIVYSVIDGREKFSFTSTELHSFSEEFLNTRLDDPRRNPIEKLDDYFIGQPYYITCIDERERLYPIWEKAKEKFYTIFQDDLYSGKPWLEILPKGINKGKTALKLKELLSCDRIVSFGDSINDLELFEVSDAVYVPANAKEEIKNKATAVIDSNDNDGVVKWLLANKSRL